MSYSPVVENYRESWKEKRVKFELKTIKWWDQLQHYKIWLNLKFLNLAKQSTARKYAQKKVNIKLKMMTSVEALQNLEKPCQIDIENGNPTAKKTFL